MASVAAAEDWAALGLAPGAPREEIRRRYRELCLRLHPDKGGTGADVDRFVRIHESYRRVLATAVAAGSSDQSSVQGAAAAEEAEVRADNTWLWTYLRAWLKPPPVVIRVPVTITDILSKSVKEIRVRVRGAGTEAVYIDTADCSEGEAVWMFEGRGDVSPVASLAAAEGVDIPRGDIRVEADVDRGDWWKAADGRWWRRMPLRLRDWLWGARVVVNAGIGTWTREIDWSPQAALPIESQALVYEHDAEGWGIEWQIIPAWSASAGGPV